MQRYFVKEKLSLQQSVQITGDDYHHMVNVMRVQPGDSCYLVDSQQHTYIAEITAIEKTLVELEARQLVDENKELPVETTLFVGLTKGDKLELVAQKATELGVHYIVPVETTYSITKWTSAKAEKKRERLQKISNHAAEQSQRQFIPKVLPLHTVNEVIQRVQDYTHFMVAYEETAKENKHAALKESYTQLKIGDDLAFFFGPEGGIHEDEIRQLTENGATLCSLGPRILRAETAPLYVLSALSYALEL